MIKYAIIIFKEMCVRIPVLAILFFLGAAGLFAQNESGSQSTAFEGTIPEELRRPRRDEFPRYPVDMVIGEMGQGKASKEAYEFAGRVASALLAGTMDAPALSSANRVFLESCMSALNVVNPRFFRLGGGREEPDGSSSFLVRFAGREQGITGELFIRFEEQRAEPVPPPPDNEQLDNYEEPDNNDEGQDNVEEQDTPVQPVIIPAVKIWIFEDLILEEPRSREAENRENRNRFDFPPYERLF